MYNAADSRCHALNSKAHNFGHQALCPLPPTVSTMTIDLESTSVSFLDYLDFDESDVAFLEEVTSGATSSPPSDDSIPNATILDEIDDELFSSSLQGNDENLGLRRECLPNLYNSSSSPSRRNSLLSTELEKERNHPAPSKRSSLVTPEPPQDEAITNSPPSLPKPDELQRQYQQTLRKLAKSMRRSDATRSIVKRQKPLNFKATTLHSSSRAVSNFFQSERCKELEESRRQLLRFINI